MQSAAAWFLPHRRFVLDGVYDRWEPISPDVPPSFDPNSRALIDDYWFVDEYVNVLDEEREHECGGATTPHSLEIMMGIFESAASRLDVDLAQVTCEHPLRDWRREHGYGESPPVPRRYWDWLAVEDRHIALSQSSSQGNRVKQARRRHPHAVTGADQFV